MAVIIVIKLQSKGRCSWNEPRATELKDNKKKNYNKKSSGSTERCLETNLRLRDPWDNIKRSNIHWLSEFPVRGGRHQCFRQIFFKLMPENVPDIILKIQIGYTQRKTMSRHYHWPWNKTFYLESSQRKVIRGIQSNSNLTDFSSETMEAICLENFQRAESNCQSRILYP